MRQSLNAGPAVLLEEAPDTRWALWPTGIGAFALTVLLGVGIWLFAPSDLTEIQPPPNIESYDYVDGVLSEVELPILVMSAYDTVEGEKDLTFRVPEANLRYFDVVHLRAHSSIGLPTRIYYERVNGELVAIYKIDAPANSGSGE